MDDPTKTPVTPLGSNQTDDPTQQPPAVPVAPKLKEQGVGSVDQKVAEVANLMQMEESNKVAKSEKDEYWENYSREIELEKEVLEMGGVEKINQGEVVIPPEIAKQMGIQTTNAHSPVTSQSSGFGVSGVTLDDSQLSDGIKKPTSSGFRWVTEWFIYELLKAHFHIKKVGGKIIRFK